MRNEHCLVIFIFLVFSWFYIVFSEVMPFPTLILKRKTHLTCFYDQYFLRYTRRVLIFNDLGLMFELDPLKPYGYYTPTCRDHSENGLNQ